MFDREVLAADVDDGLRELVDRDDLVAVPEVDGLAVGLLLHRPDHPLGEVGDVDEAALLGAVAEEFDAVALVGLDGLAAQGGNDVGAVGIQTLAGPIAVEDPDRAGVDVGVGVVGVAGDFPEDLGPAVGAVRIRRDRLIFGEAIEVVVLLAVDARAGGEQEAIDVVDAGGLQHMLIHQHGGGEPVDVLALDVVDPTY